MECDFGSVFVHNCHCHILSHNVHFVLDLNELISDFSPNYHGRSSLIEWINANNIKFIDPNNVRLIQNYFLKHGITLNKLIKLFNDEKLHQYLDSIIINDNQDIYNNENSTLLHTNTMLSVDEKIKLFKSIERLAKSNGIPNRDPTTNIVTVDKCCCCL